jgi:hypothetical protein
MVVLDKSGSVNRLVAHRLDQPRQGRVLDLDANGSRGVENGRALEVQRGSAPVVRSVADGAVVWTRTLPPDAMPVAFAPGGDWVGIERTGGRVNEGFVQVDVWALPR